MTESRRSLALSPSLVLIVIAIILFVLAAFGVDGKLGIGFVPLGLACFAGSFIF